MPLASTTMTSLKTLRMKIPVKKQRHRLRHSAKIRQLLSTCWLYRKKIVCLMSSSIIIRMTGQLVGVPVWSTVPCWANLREDLASLKTKNILRKMMNIAKRRANHLEDWQLILESIRVDHLVRSPVAIVHHLMRMAADRGLCLSDV